MRANANSRRLQVDLASLPAHEAARVKQRLDALREDCGCRVGTIVMLGAIISWAVHTFLVPTAGRSWQGTIAAGFAVLIAGALIGKLMGLGLARLRLYLEIRSLRDRIGGKATASNA